MATVIEELVMNQITTINYVAKESKEECPICLSSPPEGLVTQPCGHAACPECLTTWLQEYPHNCHYCRQGPYVAIPMVALQNREHKNIDAVFEAEVLGGKGVHISLFSKRRSIATEYRYWMKTTRYDASMAFVMEGKESGLSMNAIQAADALMAVLLWARVMFKQFSVSRPDLMTYLVLKSYREVAYRIQSNNITSQGDLVSLVKLLDAVQSLEKEFSAAVEQNREDSIEKLSQTWIPARPKHIIDTEVTIKVLQQCVQTHIDHQMKTRANSESDQSTGADR